MVDATTETGSAWVPPTPEPATPVEPSDQFLTSLTSAMRRVADDARESSLADARAAVAAKIAGMRAAASARNEELRARAEEDVSGIGEWSRAEIARIEAETERKAEQRRAQLAEQLAEHEQRSAASVAALEAQVEQYEGELALFFSQLGEITDPDAFIAAARRMPRLPQGDAVSVGEGDDDRGAFPNDRDDQLRNLGIEQALAAELTDGEGATNGVGTNGTEPEPEAATPDVETAPVAAAWSAEPEPAVPAAADPVGGEVAALSDTTTVIAAVGLGSFGAVTSFKTTLEKADGVSAVRLSLGSGGEFMYSVTHRLDVDLAPLASGAIPGASVQRSDDGVLRVNAGKRR